MDRTQKRLLVLVSLFALTALYTHTVPVGNAIPLKKGMKNFPESIGRWTGNDTKPNKDSLLPDLEEYMYRSYRDSAGQKVFFYIGYLPKFRHGKNIFSGNHISPGYGWIRTKQKEEMKKVNGKIIKIKEAVFKKGGKCKSIFYWYYTNRGTVTDRDEGRFLYAFDALLNNNTNVALIRVSSVPQLSQDCAFSTDEELFINELLPYLAKFLPFE